MVDFPTQVGQSPVGIPLGSGAFRGATAPGTVLLGMGIEIEFLPSPIVLASQFKAFGAKFKSMRVPLKRSIQQVFSPSFMKNFDVGGRPPWEPLDTGQGFGSISETTKGGRGSKRWDNHELGYGSTARRRIEAGYPPTEPILVRSRRLQRTAGQLNIWTINGPAGIAFVHGVPGHSWYGILHQSGGGYKGSLPARPWAVIQPEDMIEMEGVFLDWADELIAKSPIGI